MGPQSKRGFGLSLYLTEHFVSNEVGRVCKMAGPKIEAESFEDAEKQGEVLGLTVLGRWEGDVEWSGADDFCDRVQRQRDEDWLKDQGEQNA